MTHVSVTTNLSFERILEILSGVLDNRGSMQYVDHEMPDGFDIRNLEWLKDKSFWLNCDKAHFAPLVGGVIRFTEVYEEEEDQKIYELDLNKIQSGLNMMATQSPHQFYNIISGNDDLWTHDVFIQYCLFGRVVYT